MRSLTIIKNVDGKIKVAQFSNYLPCTWSDEYESSESVLKKSVESFINILSNKENVRKICNSLVHIDFYNSKDNSSFYKMFTSQKRSDRDYYNRWFEHTTGDQILIEILKGVPKNLKLQDYSSRMNDKMFSDVVFVVDFQKMTADVEVNRKLREHLNLIM